MNFKRAKAKVKRIRQERTLLGVYAVAVTTALLVYVYNNNSVRASLPDDEELVEIIPEDTAYEDAFSLEDDLRLAEDEAKAPQTVEIEDLPKEAEVAEDMLTLKALGVNEEDVKVEKGDSFIGILTKMGLEYAEATNIYTAYKKVYDARKVKVGQVLHISSLTDSKYNDAISITKIMTEPVSGTRYIVEKNADGKYEARTEQDDLTEEIKVVSGTINGTVGGSMKVAGVPNNIVGNFINIFSYSVDLRRDVRAGDKFEVKYEQNLAPNGNVVKTGDIIYAELTLGKVKTALYRFKDSSGTVDYYDEKGQALKKSLDRKPLEYKKARVSSKFGTRFHPILKQYRMHSGVDYAAPQGTKVYASGDGTVTKAKWVNGYGNYVTIRHNSEYSTGYGHLKAYAKGIRPGVRVKQGQVIAYVGSTGRSTGPHLHFEVIRNGKKVDPLKIKAATGESLSGEKLKAFKKVVAQINNAGATETKVASKKDDAVANTGNIASNTGDTIAN
ncbi:MAG: peptidoglycan DD-metalloendopeptidase family protein [Alphaproteobacteria bacterium]|nr:peptidoglycan DD-metalloendopeptidase family protein [Alphaproteobacteria bacterium]